MNILKTLVAVKTVKGTTFACIRDYTNKQNEKSNQTFVLGAKWENVLKNDIEKLTKCDFSILGEKYEMDEINQVKAKILLSLETRTKTEAEKTKLLADGNKTLIKSQAQNDAYITIGNGLKVKDNSLYISGLVVKKTVIEKGEYSPDTRTPYTILKSDIEKTANLSSTKYKTFILENANQLALQGIVIE